jgi:hypothetical protein
MLLEQCPAMIWRQDVAAYEPFIEHNDDPPEGAVFHVICSI